MFTRQELDEASRLVHTQMAATPQYLWPTLSQRLGLDVWVKHENHTPTGAFKIRGGIVYVDYLRNNKSFNAPDWFLDSMPPPDLLGDKILDGELWAGRDNFQLMGIVRKKIPIPEEWLSIQYQVYDITNLKIPFEVDAELGENWGEVG